MKGSNVNIWGKFLNIHSLLSKRIIKPGPRNESNALVFLFEFNFYDACTTKKTLAAEKIYNCKN